MTADGACLHELFEAQAARTPAATAVVFEGRSLSYRELNSRANQLAARLRGLGVGPETRVGLLLHRSPGLVVAVLGVLKAGGAFVPLDPLGPADRLASLIDDASPHVVVIRDMPPAPLQARFLSLGSLAYSGDRPEADPPHVARPENLACVLYADDPAGPGEGTLVEHRQLVRYLVTIAGRLGLEAGCSYAMVHPLTVDSSLTALFAPLVLGGCLHVLSRDAAADGPGMGDYLTRHRIDLLKIAPAHLAALLESGEPARLLPRRWLVLAGHGFRWAWARGLAELGACAVVAEHGPPETTVGVLLHGIDRGVPPDRWGTTPLGRPLPGTRVYVLDDGLEPAPIGVPGTLYLGGATVSRGYLGRPALTAERFVPDPFGSAPGARLFRSGDRVRWHPSGELEHVGWDDGRAQVRDSDLPARADGTAGRPGAPEPDPAPGDARLVAPRNQAEAALAAVWRDVLGLEEVGVTDSFFSLGGDSILTIRMVAMARKAGLWLTPRQVFQTQTIAELAALSVAPAPGAGTSKPMTPELARLVEEGAAAEASAMVLGLEVEEGTPPECLGEAFGRLATRHDGLRVGAGVEGGPAVATGSAAFEVLGDETEWPAEAALAARAAKAALVCRLDPGDGRLIGGLLLERKGRRPQLWLALHELVADGPSWRILLDELAGLAERAWRGSATDLPPGTSAFQAGERWWRMQAAGLDRARELEHWETTVREPMVGPPLDRTGPTSGRRTATAYVLLDADDTRAVVHEAPAAAPVEVEELLLGALAGAFASLGLEGATLVEIERDGRSRLPAEAGHAIGRLGWMQPVRLDLDPAAEPDSRLKAVKRSLRGAPGAGAGHALLRCAVPGDDIAARALRLPRPRAALRWLGTLDERAPGRVLGWEPPTRLGGRCLSVEASVINGRLSVAWTYDADALEEETVTRLTAAFGDELRRLGEHCASGSAAIYTTADFPEAGLSEGELETLLETLNVAGESRP